MTSDEYAEIAKLADEVFDRTQPALVQKAKLLRYKELLAKAGEDPTVAMHWLGDPNPPKLIDPVHDELEHVEWRIANGR